MFQPTSGVSAPAAAAAAEVSLDKVDSSDDKSTCSGLSQVRSTVEASGDDAAVSNQQDERERLTFHIALGESGFASLGISVTKVYRNRQDCGIFIKSVRVGGMAAKVWCFIEEQSFRCLFWCCVTVDMVVQRCDGRHWLLDHDGDDDLMLCNEYWWLCSNFWNFVPANEKKLPLKYL